MAKSKLAVADSWFREGGSAGLAQAEAEAIAALGIEEKGAVVVTAAEGWHPGVVGLVAARLREKFNRPAFAIALEPGGIGTGSGRSMPGVDIGRAVRRAVSEGILLKGGGHAMAAGVTLRKGALAEWRAYLEAALAADVEIARRASGLLIDGAVTAAAIPVGTANSIWWVKTAVIAPVASPSPAAAAIHRRGRNTRPDRTIRSGFPPSRERIWALVRPRSESPLSAEPIL